MNPVRAKEGPVWVALDVSETFNTGQSCRGRPPGAPSLLSATHGVWSLGENNAITCITTLCGSFLVLLQRSTKQLVK